MEELKKAYISLGSNLGDKFKNLQSALQAIHEQIGNIRQVTKVFETPAWGFQGDSFYNACIMVETNLTPNKLLKQLLQIEKQLGRVRAQTKQYESRIIDLDIILYQQEIIHTKALQIPHPEMHKRKFVLEPLHTIASQEIHPVLQENIQALWEKCADQSVMKPLNIWLKNPSKQYTFSKFNFIAIEGNIGAGKTSLAKKIAANFNAKLILERFADNPFLPKFYADPKRYAFTLEMSFLADRYQQISDDLAQLDLFKDFIVSDYDVYKSLIFSKITLPEDEFKLYRKLFYQVYKDIKKPDLYIYLYQSTERLKENIKKRGRKYEQQIDTEYLEKINTGYLEFLKKQTNLQIKIIDVTQRDFVNSRTDYLWLIHQICNA